jgi:hypothetical protein
MLTCPVCKWEGYLRHEIKFIIFVHKSECVANIGGIPQQIAKSEPAYVIPLALSASRDYD